MPGKVSLQLTANHGALFSRYASLDSMGLRQVLGCLLRICGPFKIVSLQLSSIHIVTVSPNILRANNFGPLMVLQHGVLCVVVELSQT